MNITQIKYFVSVMAQGSLSLAAKEQYVTVQAVSKGIADLERELGEPLFVRENRGVSPTQFGHAFFQKALPALQAFEELESFSANQHGGKASESTMTLGLCMPHFPNVDIACRSIETFLTKHFDLAVSIRVLSGKEGFAAVRANTIDGFIIIGSAQQPDLDCAPIGTMFPGVVMHEGHPLLAKETVSIADMQQYPVFSSTEFEFFHDSVMNTYRKPELLPHLQEITATRDDFERGTEENAIFFAGAIPSLSRLWPDVELRFINPEEVVPIPVSFIRSKRAKTTMSAGAAHMLSNLPSVFDQLF